MRSRETCIYITALPVCRQGALPHCQLSHLRLWTGWVETSLTVFGTTTRAKRLFFFFTSVLLYVMDTLALAQHELSEMLFWLPFHGYMTMLTLSIFASLLQFFFFFRSFLPWKYQKLMKALNCYLLKRKKKGRGGLLRCFLLHKHCPNPIIVFTIPDVTPSVGFPSSVITGNVSNHYFCIVLAFFQSTLHRCWYLCGESCCGSFL